MFLPASSSANLTSCRLLETSLLPIAQRLMRGIAARRPGNASSRVRSRAAQIKSFDRRAILRPPGHGTHKEELLQPQIAVKNVALGKAVCALQIQRSEHLPRLDRVGNVRGVLGDLLYNAISQQFALVIPVSLT